MPLVQSKLCRTTSLRDHNQDYNKVELENLFFKELVEPQKNKLFALLIVLVVVMF